MTSEMKEKLQMQLASLLSEVEHRLPKNDSLEWYLANQIRRYIVALESSTSKQEIENATAMFSRFCTESMDWDTSLYKKCAAITASGTKLAKTFLD